MAREFQLQDPTVETISVEFPVIEENDSYVSLKLEARLTERQAKALKRLTDGLDAIQARTEDGNRIIRNPDAIRWLLEQMATAIDKAA